MVPSVMVGLIAGIPNLVTAACTDEVWNPIHVGRYISVRALKSVGASCHRLCVVTEIPIARG
jgi:hypothetical protein